LVAETGYPLPSVTTVWIPNPAAFVGQKLIIHRTRSADRRPQSILYIHDTLELFEHELDMLRDAWRQTAAGLSSAALARLSESRGAVFEGVTDTIRNAARIPADRTIRPERIQAFCKQALNHIFEV
jgi:hypothetical protein